MTRGRGCLETPHRRPTPGVTGWFLLWSLALLLAGLMSPSTPAQDPSALQSTPVEDREALPGPEERPRPDPPFQEPPTGAGRDDVPAPLRSILIIRDPEDLKRLREAWLTPDQVLIPVERLDDLRGEIAEEIEDRDEAPSDPGPAATLPANRLTVSIRPGERTARVRLTYEILREAISPGGAAWVDLGLSSLTVRRARLVGPDGPGRDLAVRRDPDGRWSLDLARVVETAPERDRIRVAIETQAPIVVTGTESRIDINVPPIPSTLVTLLADDPDVSAWCDDAALMRLDARTRPPERASGADEDDPHVPGDLDPQDDTDLEQTGTGPVREPGSWAYQSWVAPAERLTVRWSSGQGGRIRQPPLFTWTGSLRVDVRPETLVTQGTYRATLRRGVAERLELRADLIDEVVAISVDGEPVDPDRRIEGGAAILRLPLSSSIRSGDAVEVRIECRRPLPWDPGGSDRQGRSLMLRGVELIGAVDQTGMIALRRDATQRVSCRAISGVASVDPGTDLPGELIGPDVTAAFRFWRQPFELAIEVDRISDEVRILRRNIDLVLDDGAEFAWQRAVLQLEAPAGWIDAIDLPIPPGLEILEVGPASAVRTYEQRSRPGGARTLRIQVAGIPARSDRFRLEILGRQRLSTPEAELALIRLDGLASPGILRLAAPRRLAVELSSADANLDQRKLFHPLGSGPLANEQPIIGRDDDSADLAPDLRETAGLDWPSIANPRVCTWTCAGTAETLPLRVVERPTRREQAQDIEVAVELDRIEIQQRIDVHAYPGPIDRLVLRIPRGLTILRATIDGESRGVSPPIGPLSGPSRMPEALRRVEIEDVPDRPHVTLQIDARADVPSVGTDDSTTWQLPWIQVEEAALVDARLVLSTPAQLEVEWAASSGWKAVEPDLARSALDTERRLVRGRYRPPSSPPGEDAASATKGPGPIQLDVRLREAVPLPAGHADFGWLRIRAAPDGDVRVVSVFRLRDSPVTLDLALPGASGLIAASFDGIPLEPIADPIAEPGRYLLDLPASAAIRGDTRAGLLILEYRIAEQSGGPTPVRPPVFINGVIDELFCEIQIPWSRTLIGSPTGWTDLNGWQWAGYVWKRVPEVRLGDLLGGREQLGTTEGSPPLPGGTTDRLAALIDGEPTSARSGYQGFVFHSPSARPTSIEARIAPRWWVFALCSGAAFAFGLLVLTVWPERVRIGIAALVPTTLLAWTIAPALTGLVVQSGLTGLVLAFVGGWLKQVIERSDQSGSHGSRPRDSSLHSGSSAHRPARGDGPRPQSSIHPETGGSGRDRDRRPVTTISYARPDHVTATGPRDDAGPLSARAPRPDGSTQTRSPGQGRSGSEPSPGAGPEDRIVIEPPASRGADLAIPPEPASEGHTRSG